MQVEVALRGKVLNIYEVFGLIGVEPTLTTEGVIAKVREMALRDKVLTNATVTEARFEVLGG
jgi:hypothetical protein